MRSRISGGISRIGCVILRICGVIGVTLLITGLGVSCAREESVSASGGTIDYRDPESLKELIETSSEAYILLDVRTPEEFGTGFIPTAVNIPVQMLEQNPPDVPKHSLVILYCRSGARSGQAQQMLENQGYTRVVDFGGINRWIHALVRE